MRTETIKNQVCRLIGLSEEAYAQIVEKLGYDFAWHYSGHHKWTVEYLTRTAAYWRWWNGLQYLRDETFVAEMSDYANTNSEAELLELWLDANAPDEIEERPTKQVLQSTYKIMLEAVDKERNGKLDNHFISR